MVLDVLVKLLWISQGVISQGERKEEKEQAILRAEAEAESIRIRSEALAQNKDLVEWEDIQKWDGKLPVQMLGAAPVPFLNLSRH